jgi:protein involved in sex pheromone biosynthesis
VRKFSLILLTLTLLLTACGGGTDTSTDETVAEESSESLDAPATTVATESLSGQKNRRNFHHVDAGFTFER